MATRQIIWADGTAIKYSSLPFRNSYKSWAGMYEFPVDRFNVTHGSLELGCVNLLKDPIYNLQNISNDWEDRYFDHMKTVADKVFETAGTRTVNLLYSGGIDSVGVYCALRQSKYFKQFLDEGRFKLSLTSTSITEYPHLFFKEILPEIDLVPLDFNKLMNDSNTMLVTGEPGDYIVGNSDVNMLDCNLMDSWGKFLRTRDNSLDLYYEMCLMAHARAPFQIVSVNQLVWWVNQCFSYQEPLIKPYIWSSVTDMSTMLTNEKVFSFFSDDLMTAFSYEYMSTNPVYEKPADLRRIIKQFIFNYTNDVSYLTKEKVYSQRLTLRNLYKNIIYLEDGVIKSELINEKVSL